MKRGKATRSAKRYFYLFAEGEKTERDYFGAVEKTLDARKVKIIYRGALGVPKTVATKAIDFAQEKGLIKSARRKKLNSFEENDQVWAIFDRDDFSCYYDAKNMCEGAKISYAYSDPCFELWLNLHFDNHDAPCSRFAAQARTKALIEGYDPDAGKTADFSTLMCKLSDAENRAAHQRKARQNESNRDGNPSTNVYELTQKLRE